MRNRVILATALLVASLILFSDVRLISAHGEPEKVVEGFRDFKTGQRLLVPISFQIRIRDPQTEKFVFESLNLRATNGVGDLIYSFSLAGFYEIFLAFEKTDEPRKIYRPEDWYVWVPAGQADEAHGYYGIIVISGLLAAISGMAWRSRRKGNREKGIHGALLGRSFDESRF